MLSEEARRIGPGSDLPWLVDAHLDLAWNALQWNRDLREPVSVLRVREAADVGPGRGSNTVSLPDLAAGGVRVCFATLLARSSGVAKAHVDYASAEQAHAVARGQLAYYRALERSGHLTVVDGTASLDRHVADASGPRSLPLGVVVAMEGADPLLVPDEIQAWAELGLRLLGLAHYGPGRYAGGTGTSSGLTDLGRDLLAQMQVAGVALDLTHLADRGFWEAIERFPGPVHVSHGNCRALVSHGRQLTDDQIRAVAERGGVIGVALDAWMLEPGWVKGVSRPDGLRLDLVADHVEHVCTVTGSTAHVGLGSDLDGGFGREQGPEDLDTVADLGRVLEVLGRRGFGRADVEAIAHGNWIRFLRKAWGAPAGPVAHRTRDGSRT